MATIDEVTGTIQGTTLAEYIDELEAVFSAAFGDTMRYDPETPQAQIISGIADSLSQVDQTLVASFQALDITRAFAQQLDGHGSLLAIPRHDATQSVVDVALTGVASALIPAGSRARTNDGDLFELRDDVQLDGSGNATGVMQSVETGEVGAPAGTLVTIVDLVAGWETVTNAADATLGRAREIDGDYTRRYFNEIDKNAVAPIAAIISQIAEQDGVTDVAGRENDTDSPIVVQNVTIAPHSVAIVVEGGTDADIGEAVKNSKTTGTGTVGTTTVVVTYEAGFTRDINFYRADLKGVEIDLDITLTADFPANGLDLLKQRIVNYFNGDFEIVTDSFEIDGIRIAETLYKSRLYTPINSVQGHVVNSLTMQSKPGGGDVSSLAADLDERWIIEAIDDITITVT